MSDIMQDRSNMFYEHVRILDNDYHGMFEIIFGIRVAARLFRVCRTVNRELMRYLQGRSTLHFLVVDLQQPIPKQLLPGEPTPRLRGPFLPPRCLPLGRQYREIVCFSSNTFTLMIPHEVRSWIGMELLLTQLRCLRVRSYYDLSHAYPYGFQTLTP